MTQYNKLCKKSPDGKHDWNDLMICDQTGKPVTVCDICGEKYQ